MHYDKDYAPVGNITSTVNRDYCLKHGYPFHLTIGWHDPEGVHPVFAKIYDLHHHLRYDESDWFMWIDADAVILDHDVDATDFIQTNKDLVITEDVNGLNTGVFFIRNSLWSRNLIASIYALRRMLPNRTMVEQDAMKALLQLPVNSENVYYAPQRSFNAYIEPHYGRSPDLPSNYHPGDFILHLPGMSQEDRIKILKQHLNQ